MEVLYPQACGLDVHKKSVVACCIIKGRRYVRTFGTSTSELLELARWLDELGVTAAAMESSGVYWIPVFNVLESIGLDKLMVVNAEHIKKVPGRKTDVTDAEWIADLLRHGLLKASLIPARPERELRELLRYRKSLIETRTAEVNRIQKVLEGGNVKLASVASDVTGKSALSMLWAMIHGESDPETLANLARGKLRSKHEELREALTGVVGDHQRRLLRMLLEHIDYLDKQIEELDREAERRLAAHQDPLERLDTIPGVGRRGAEIMMATFGLSLDAFPTSGHLASWAGVCPGQNQSGGKRKRGRTRKGNHLLKTGVMECARAASRTKNTYLSTYYSRLARRIGGKRAAVALAHAILTIAYHILKEGTVYNDLGPNYFDERDKERIVRGAVRRLRRLGHEVVLKPVA